MSVPHVNDTEGAPAGFLLEDVWRDDRPGVPASQRWKAIFSGGYRNATENQGGRDKGAWVMGSADGIRFTHAAGNAGPALFCSDTQDVSLGWVPHFEKYAMFIRHDGPDEHNPNGAGGPGRRVALCLTDDLADFGSNRGPDADGCTSALPDGCRGGETGFVWAAANAGLAVRAPRSRARATRQALRS